MRWGGIRRTLVSVLILFTAVTLAGEYYVKIGGVNDPSGGSNWDNA